MRHDSNTPDPSTEPPRRPAGRWQERARFCPLCAGGLQPGDVAGRERLCCQGCGWVLFANPASAGAAVVVDEARRVLLIRRSIAPHAGAWALPAGYQEIDEDPRQAVVREVLEETGARIEVGPLLEVMHIADDPRKPANVIIYLCRYAGGVLCAADDAVEVRFFPLDGLPANIGFDNRRRVLEPLRLRVEAGEWDFARSWSAPALEE